MIERPLFKLQLVVVKESEDGRICWRKQDWRSFLLEVRMREVTAGRSESRSKDKSQKIIRYRRGKEN